MQQDSSDYIVVIGAANIDIIGSAFEPVIMGDSNPGRMQLCAGGVGRNIAENLARLSVDVRFIGPVGDDVFGRKLLEMTGAAGVDMSCCHTEENVSSSAYLAILDNEGEMKLALSDMRAVDELPVQAIDRHRQVIDNAKLLVLDANLSQDIISHILDSFPEAQILIDPVSIGKAKHIQSFIGKFDTIKMNLLEAGFLSGITIGNEPDLLHAGQFFLDKGTRRVFITMGSGGVFYQTGDEGGICKSPYITPANVTGAGDAFTAGVAYCTMHGKDIRHTSEFACAMARIALKSRLTVSPQMSTRHVHDEIDKIRSEVT